MKGAKRKDLDILNKKIEEAMFDQGQFSFDSHEYDEALKISKELKSERSTLLDSLTVLEITPEEWSAHPKAVGVAVMFAYWPEQVLRNTGDNIITYIRRPSAPRLTDAEIEFQATAAGLEAHDARNRDGRTIVDCLEAYRIAYDYKKSRLDAKRGA